MSEAKNEIRLDAVVMLHVWVHSHIETRKPLSVDVFEIDGRVNMQWFTDVFDGEYNNSDLAEQFYKYLGKLDTSAWFEVKPMYETACEPPEACCEVVGVVQHQ